MNLNQFKQLLIALQPRRSPILSVSGPGIGKTAVHKQVTDDLSRLTKKPWEYYSLVLTNYDSFDIPGYLVPQRHADGTLRAEYTEPFFWRNVFDWDGVNKFGILHLDEVTDCETPAQKIAAQIVFDRRVGPRYLPDGCWVLMSGNRRKDKSGVQRLATMFQNRLREIAIDYHTETHSIHMQRHGFHVAALSFIEQEFAACFKDEVPNEPGPFMTPRSFEEGVLDLTQIGKDMGLPSHKLPGVGKTDADLLAQNVLMGAIGAGAAAQFFTHLKYADQLPTIDEIALDPVKAKVPDSLGGQYMVSFMLGAQSSDRNLPQVMEYFKRMKVEMQTITARRLVDRNRDSGDLKNLYSVKGFTDWCRVHNKVVLMSVV